MYLIVSGASQKIFYSVLSPQGGCCTDQFLPPLGLKMGINLKKAPLVGVFENKNCLVPYRTSIFSLRDSYDLGEACRYARYHLKHLRSYSSAT